MPSYYAKEAVKILRDDGVAEFSRRVGKFLRFNSASTVHNLKLRCMYDAESLPRLEYRVPPSNIKYDIRNRVQNKYGWESRYPPFTVLGGDWDQLKSNFEDKWIFHSYIQRFEKNIPWEETRYYTNYRQKGYTHEAAMEELNKYDGIYHDIKENGYDESKPVRVYIGRNGEYMRVTGQNRLCIAKVLGLESIPVRINLVHKQWQELVRTFIKTVSQRSTVRSYGITQTCKICSTESPLAIYTTHSWSLFYIIVLTTT